MTFASNNNFKYTLNIRKYILLYFTREEVYCSEKEGRVNVRISPVPFRASLNEKKITLRGPHFKDKRNKIKESKNLVYLYQIHFSIKGQNEN